MVKSGRLLRKRRPIKKKKEVEERARLLSDGQTGIGDKLTELFSGAIRFICEPVPENKYSFSFVAEIPLHDNDDKKKILAALNAIIASDYEKSNISMEAFESHRIHDESGRKVVVPAEACVPKIHEFRLTQWQAMALLGGAKSFTLRPGDFVNVQAQLAALIDTVGQAKSLASGSWAHRVVDLASPTRLISQ